MCSCGDHSNHVVASRRTFDGKRVEFWSDGAIVFLFGGWLQRPGRSRWGAQLRKVASELIREDVCLWDASELPERIKAAQTAARHVLGYGWSMDTGRAWMRTIGTRFALKGNHAD